MAASDQFLNDPNLFPPYEAPPPQQPLFGGRGGWGGGGLGGGFWGRPRNPLDWLIPQGFLGHIRGRNLFGRRVAPTQVPVQWSNVEQNVGAAPAPLVPMTPRDPWAGRADRMSKVPPPPGPRAGSKFLRPDASAPARTLTSVPLPGYESMGVATALPGSNFASSTDIWNSRMYTLAQANLPGVSIEPPQRGAPPILRYDETGRAVYGTRAVPRSSARPLGMKGKR